MENELEIEQRRAREYAANNRKIERQYNEIRIQIEDEIRVKTELADANNTLANKVRTLRCQLEEAVRVSCLFIVKHSFVEWKFGNEHFRTKIHTCQAVFEKNNYKKYKKHVWKEIGTQFTHRLLPNSMTFNEMLV